MIGNGKWDIQDGPVYGILSNVSNQLSEFGIHLTNINSALSAGAEASQSSIVGQALSEFAEAKQADVAAITGRITNAVSGAQTATQAYVNGDLQMAANAHAGIGGNQVPPPLGGDTSAPLGGRGFGAQPRTDSPGDEQRT